MSTRFYVENGCNLDCNVYAVNGSELMYASVFGLSTAIRAAESLLNKKDTKIFCGYRTYTNFKKDLYNVYTAKVPNSDFAHLIMVRKDGEVEEYESMRLRLTVMAEGENSMCNIDNNITYVSDDNGNTKGTRNIVMSEDVENALFNKLYSHSSVPIIKEWVGYIAEQLALYSQLSKCGVTGRDNMVMLTVNTTEQSLKEIISDGLKNGSITINGCPYVSDKIKSVTGIDSYLSTHSELLSEKIQSAFVPRYSPGKEDYSKSLNNYSEYAEYSGKMKFFNAQKDVIQGISTTLKEKDAAFVIGECGTGKTAMAIGTICAAAGFTTGLTNIIMCPSHLQDKWKREIERLAPISEAVIVKNLSELLALMPKIKNKKFRNSLWIVMSYETLSGGYAERPAAVWSNVHKSFVCPKCGKPLYDIKKEKKIYYKVPFGKNAFMSRTAINERCMNMIRDEHSGNDSEEKVLCNAKLWQAFNKSTDYDNELCSTSEWVKFSKDSWMLKKHMLEEVERLQSLPHLEPSDKRALAMYLEYDEDKPVVAPRTYPIGKFIRKHLKNQIDYLALDEIHLLKGKDTCRGQAAGDLTSAAKKVLGLTGTLINGYADSIFYILFRMFPSAMLKDGYGFKDCMKFAIQYGVVAKTSKHNTRDNKVRSNVKTMPGISPLVFTNFLLDNAAFISLDDIADGLPDYKEIPVSCKMDENTADGYSEIAQAFKDYSNMYKGDAKYMAQLILLMMLYPDQPWGHDDVVNPEDPDDIICSPMEYHPVIDDKQEKTMDIVRRKVEAGEKVLVYVNWINKTETCATLAEKMAEEGIDARIMFAERPVGKSAKYGKCVKAIDREKWINEQLADGMQVLICNPKLVETGLDLLDFTTIIFYQVGYNLSDMRQASRRSWRLGQAKDIEVYYMYYADTVQDAALKLMAGKLKAAMAIEGKFSEEGLNAMCSSEEGDMLTQIASSVVDGIKNDVTAEVFSSVSIKSAREGIPKLKKTLAETQGKIKSLSFRDIYLNKMKSKKKPAKLTNSYEHDVYEGLQQYIL